MRRKIRDRLRLAVFEQLEIVFAQTFDGVAVFVGDDDVDVVNAHFDLFDEGGLLLHGEKECEKRNEFHFLTSTSSAAIPDRCASPSRTPTAMWCSPGDIFMCNVCRHHFDFAASYSATGISTTCS